MVDEPKRKAQDSGMRGRKRAPIADRKAREFLRKADPVLARLIDDRPDFRPRAWMDELPPLDAFGTLIFQVVGQQLSVSATRAILSRVEGHFGGHLPSPAELLAADPDVLRKSGMSTRRGATLRALAERFVDGRLSNEAFARMTDAEVEAALLSTASAGPWPPRPPWSTTRSRCGSRPCGARSRASCCRRPKAADRPAQPARGTAGGSRPNSRRVADPARSLIRRLERT